MAAWEAVIIKAEVTMVAWQAAWADLAAITEVEGSAALVDRVASEEVWAVALEVTKEAVVGEDLVVTTVEAVRAEVRVVWTAVLENLEEGGRSR